MLRIILYLAATVLSAVACDKTPANKPTHITPSKVITVDGQFPIVAWRGIDYNQAADKYGPMKACGINTYLGWEDSDEKVIIALDEAQKAGVKVIIGTEGKFHSDPESLVAKIKDHPALLMYHVKDEPGRADFPMLADVVKRVKAVDRKHPCYINLYPNWAWGWEGNSYSDNVLTFLRDVPVEFISFDYYPVHEINGVSSLRPAWYQNLEDIRRISRAKDLPFWAFALAISHTLEEVLYPVPTLGELRLQMFSNLVYGAQGFQYFTFAGIYRNSQTSIYGSVTTVNKELQGLSKVFLKASIDNVWHIGETVPKGTKKLNTMPKGVKSISIDNAAGAVVSEISKEGKRYLAIVNKDYRGTMNLNIDFNSKAYQIDKAGNKGAVSTNSFTLDPGDIVVFMFN